ncbi:MAG: flagellin, partial [Terracidiphilus sp.]
TLATEASNGTLNSSQDTAANQEYQSILSEISNIGSTTTYNGTAVFNKQTNIYTGDSSTSGSSINTLNIRTLSSSNIGDSAGVMAYSAGTNNVFINLSTASTNAQATDTLNTSGTTSINVNYLVKGANNAEVSALATITVGGDSGFQNTANGLISAINSQGLGLTASFTTAAQAGVAGGTTQTGIQITGGAISVGVDPNAVSTSGILNPNGITSENFNLGQTITVTAGGTTAASFVIGSSTNTLDTLAAAITAGTGASMGAESVTASVITNGNGSQSIALSDTAGGGLLAVNVSGGQGVQNLSNPTLASPTTATNVSFSVGSAGVADVAPGATNPGTNATGTLTFNSGFAASSSTALTGTVVLSNGTGGSPTTDTFTMGGNGGATLGSLATAIGTALGVSTTVTSTGITMTADGVGTTLSMGSSSLSVAPAVNVSTIVNGITSTNGSNGTATLTMQNTTGAGGDGYNYNPLAKTSFNGNDTLAAGTTLVLQNGTADTPGTATSFVIGGTSSGNVIGVGGTGQNSTVNALLTAIDSGPGATATGIDSAAVNTSGQIVFTSTNVGTTISVGSGTNLADLSQMSVNVAGATTAGTVGGGASISIAGLTSATTDTLAGSITINNGLGGPAETFVMGTNAYSALVDNGAMGAASGTGGTTYTVNGDTMADLKNAINADSPLGVTAATDGTLGLSLTVTNATAYGSQISVTGTNTLTDNYATHLTGVTAGGAGGTFGTLAMTSAGQIPSTSTTQLGGTLVLSNTTGGSTITDTFVMNSKGGLNSSGGVGDTGNVWDLTTANSNITGLKAAIIDAGTETGHAAATIDLTAAFDGATNGLKISSLNNADTAISTAGSALTVNVSEVGTTGTAGGGASAIGYATNTASGNSTITLGGAGSPIAAGNTLAGSIIIGNGLVGSSPVTFQMSNGGGGTTTDGSGHTTISTAGATLGALETAIDNAGLGLTAAIDAAGTGLALNTSTIGTSISVTSANTLTDNYATTFTNPASGSNGQYESADLDMANGGSMSGITAGTGGALSGTLYLSIDRNGTNVHDTFVMNSLGGLNAAGGAGDTGAIWDLTTANSTVTGLMAAINDAGTETGVAADKLDVNATGSDPAGGLFIQALNQSTGATPDTVLTELSGTGGASTLTFNAVGNDVSTPLAGHAQGNAQVVISNNGLTDNNLNDTVTGDIVLTNSTHGLTTTFTMGGNGGANGIASGAGTANVLVSGTTLGALATAIQNSSALDVTASVAVNGSGLTITSSDSGSTVSVITNLNDSYTEAATGNGGLAPGQSTFAEATLGTGVGAINPANTGLTGTVVINNNGQTGTFDMNTAASASGGIYQTGAETLNGLMQAINADTTLDLSATVANGVLNLQSSVADTSITFGGNTLNIAASEGATMTPASGQAASLGVTGHGSTATFTPSSGTVTDNDLVTGSIAIAANGVNSSNPVTFHMGATSAQLAEDSVSNAGYNASQYYVAGNTLSTLEGDINSVLNVSASAVGGNLVLNSTPHNSISITSSGSLQDFGTSPQPSTATLGTFASESDKISGTISLSSNTAVNGGNAQSISFTNKSIDDVITQIDNSNLGVTANYVAPTNAGGYGSLTVTSNTYGSAGNITSYSGTTITDATASATVTYAQTNAYNTGISNSVANDTALYDKSSGQSNPALGPNSATPSFLANASGGSGVATISYSDGAGVSLSATDLSNETDAQGALNNLNSAITAVAAQDGYIGAQINTLNAVSQVLSTQQENVQAAQNAVQATDYAAATSNMSKYEILSQTGIAALAQANSVQQEVTKLLQ